MFRAVCLAGLPDGDPFFISIMALSRDQKTAQVKELTDKMSSSTSIIFAHYIGLSVAEVAELRAKLKEVNSEMKVAKKTLMQIAAKEAKLPELTEEHLPGPVSLIFSNDDPLAGAQIAFKFAKDHDQVELIGGIFEGNVLSKEEAVALAKMPSRDVLLATFVGMLKSPLNRFAGVCSSPLSGFARALSEMADKGGFVQEEEAPKEEVKKEEPKEAPAEEAKAETEEEKPAEETDAPEASTEEASNDSEADAADESPEPKDTESSES